MNHRIHKELFQRHPDNPILTVDDWPYPANAVFNPAATIIINEVLLLVRVEDFKGHSHLTVARSRNGIGDWQIDPVPTILPDPIQYPEEIWGIEDPRITWIEELQEWVIAYTSYSEGGPLVSLARTSDFRSIERISAVMSPEDKDAALFPKRFDGRWALIHRPVPASSNFSADIWISYSPDLKHWGDHQRLLRARRGGWWDANKIGLSPPPLETEIGWLLLYHGVRQTVSGSIYRLGLALLDLENPTRVLRRSEEWIFGPHASYEREGDVDDVVFPCGWILKEDTVYLYYGAADTSIGVAKAEVSDLLTYIKSCPESLD